jgi:hypothetical protein
MVEIVFDGIRFDVAIHPYPSSSGDSKTYRVDSAENQIRLLTYSALGDRLR